MMALEKKWKICSWVEGTGWWMSYEHYKSFWYHGAKRKKIGCEATEKACVCVYIYINRCVDEVKWRKFYVITFFLYYWLFLPELKPTNHNHHHNHWKSQTATVSIYEFMRQTLYFLRNINFFFLFYLFILKWFYFILFFFLDLV